MPYTLTPPQNRALRGMVGIIVALLALLGTPSYAQAQEGAQEILRETVGPYQISVIASSAKPAVGPLYIWITLEDTSTTAPVTDAQVQILARRVGEAREGQALALHSPVAPGTYTADINLNDPGTWGLSLQVSNPLGKATANTTLEVRESLRNEAVGTLAWGLVLVILGLGAFYVWWSTLKKRKVSDETP